MNDYLIERDDTTGAKVKRLLTDAEQAIRDARATPSTDPRDHDLDYAQWSAMLVDSGLDDVLSGAAANAKAVNRGHAAAITFAIAKAQQRTTYSFARMMELITTFAAYIPAGSDVTEATLTTHWMAAKDLV